MRVCNALLTSAMAALAAAPAAAHLPDALVGNVPAAAGALMAGGALDGRRDRVDFGAVTLEINGSAAVLDADGHFAAQVMPSDYYQLRIGGTGVFEMVQTFGHAELFSAGCGCLDIPAIELVAKKRGRVELFFAGDTMAGRRFSAPVNGNPRLLNDATLDADLDALLAPMRPYFESADMASLNLESVLADDKPGGSPPKRFTFFSPTAFARALKRAGIDHVSLGNNHTYDYLDAGLTSTIAALDAAGMAHSGAGMSAAQAIAAAPVDAGGTQLAMLGFVGWEGHFEPNQTANEVKGGAAHGNIPNIRNATRDSDREGLVPIVQYHGSAEYADRPSDYSVRRMREAIDHGAPVVSSHHPHVTQGLELYQDGLIAYSLGNFLFDQERSETQASFAMKVWLENGRFLRAEVIPIQILDYRPVPAVGSMREAVLRRTAALSAERGTYLQISGGHAVVRAERAFRQPGKGVIPECPEGSALLRISFLKTDPDARCIPAATAQAGEDMMMRGDFENASYGGSVDRSWGSENARIEFAREDSGGFLRLHPVADGQAMRLFQGPYMRRLAPGRYTLQARVRAPQGAALEFALKRRPAPGEATTARWRGQYAGGSVLHSAAGWQDVTFDFTILGEASEEPWPVRPIVSLTPATAGASLPIDLDDLRIVRWLSPEEATSPGSAWAHARAAGDRTLAAAAPISTSVSE